MSYQDKIRERKREQFRDKQQRNRIVGQLNRDYTALKNADPTLTAEDIFAQQAGMYGAGATQPYTVKDGDTIESISGGNPVGLLNQNPDVKNIQTGMVINVPRPYNSVSGVPLINMGVPPSVAMGKFEDASPYNRFEDGSTTLGGFGLPSNAALGGTTTNPQGGNSFQPRPGSDAWRAKNIYQAPQTPNFPRGPIYVPPGLSQTQRAAVATNISGMRPAAAPIQPARPANPALPSTFQNYSMKEETYHFDLFEKVNSPNYTPTQADLNYLEHRGLIKKSKPQPAYLGGSGGYRGGGGRGRRGGGGGRGGVQQADRLPAFSSGAGNLGLINWRI
jgi:hypothetical protein